MHQDTRSPDHLELKTQAKLHLRWKQSIKRVVCLNIAKYFNVIMGLSEVTKLLKKHNVDIRSPTMK